jgi:hypothetical protein
VQQVPGRQPQRLGVIPGGLLQQVRLGAAPVPGTDEGGERGDRVGDHLRLLEVDHPVQQRRGGRLEGHPAGAGGAVDAVELAGQPDQAVRLAADRAGRGGEPGAGRGRRGLRREVDPVPVGEQHRLQRRDPRLRATQLQHGFGGLPGRQHRDRDPAGGDLVEDLVHPAGEPVHPVRPRRHRRPGPPDAVAAALAIVAVLVLDLCHDPTLRPTTDNYRTRSNDCEDSGTRSSVSGRRLRDEPVRVGEGRAVGDDRQP